MTDHGGFVRGWVDLGAGVVALRNGMAKQLKLAKNKLHFKKHIQMLIILILSFILVG